MIFSGIIASETLGYGLGFTGEDKVLTQIIILSVIKNYTTKEDYLVYGKILKNDTIFNFQGNITLKKIFVRNLDDKGQHYLLIGNYLFYEDKNGVLKGNCYFKIKLEEHQFKTDYYGILDEAKFINNAFLGVWENPSENNNKQCNWGFVYPPESGDLDVGGEDDHFLPNKKYAKYGWQSYLDALGGGVIVFPSSAWWDNCKHNTSRNKR